MVRSFFAIPNCTAYIYTQLSLCIYQSHSAPQNKDIGEAALSMATCNRINALFAFAGASNCVWQFLE